MSRYPIRKRPTETSREVAELRAVFSQSPGYYGTPLARALAELASEYAAIGNHETARRHMNASLRAMQFALDDPEIDDGRRRSVVEFRCDSARIHQAMGNLTKALRDLDEALEWDRKTWNFHEYCLSSRELRHANILTWKARLLDELDREDEAAESRAEAILVALSDPDFKELKASKVVSKMANDLVDSGA